MADAIQMSLGVSGNFLAAGSRCVRRFLQSYSMRVAAICFTANHPRLKRRHPVRSGLSSRVFRVLVRFRILVLDMRLLGVRQRKRILAMDTKVGKYEATKVTKVTSN